MTTRDGIENADNAAADTGIRERVVVVGSGCGAMAAAWGLLSQPGGPARYDVHIYQFGWRCGGKGASGRNLKRNDRIEEHGLHIWSGMYENAFRMMRGVYADLDRSPTLPLSTCYDPHAPERSAFLPHNLVTLGDWQDGQWQMWNIAMPDNNDTPGTATQVRPSLVTWLLDFVEAVLNLTLGADMVGWIDARLPLPGSFRRLQRIERIFEGAERAVASFLVAGARGILHDLRSVAERMLTDEDHETLLEEVHADDGWYTDPSRGGLIGRLLNGLMQLRKMFLDTLSPDFSRLPGLRRAFGVLDLGLAMFVGLISDRILLDGFDVVDDEEFNAWLARHGATNLAIQSAVARGWHAFAFAYVNGDPSRPSIAASSALRSLLRCVFTFRGAFFWRMQAGMGDTVFAPLYEWLVARGATFHFFHKVEELSCLDDHGLATTEVKRIRISRQVSLAPGRTVYEPLVTIGGVPSWPSEPLWDQLDPSEVASLQSRGVDLESWWTDWTPIETRELVAGEHFDRVIMTVPPAAARYLTPTMRHVRVWEEMLENIASNQTCAAQVWLQPSLHEAGWPHGETVGTLFANPHNTWANMDHLIRRESWSDRAAPPQQSLYLCGVMPDAVPMPPFSDAAFPARQSERVCAASIAWLQANTGFLYPKLIEPTEPDLAWQHLVCQDENVVGEDRFLQQFWRLNIQPSERYTLSLPGTARYRLRAGESGFSNMVIAGDWLHTGLNVGCVEAAVMGGLQAAEVILGVDLQILGDEGIWAKRPPRVDAADA